MRLYLAYQILNILFNVMTLQRYNMILWICCAQTLLTRYYVKPNLKQLKFIIFFWQIKSQATMVLKGN